jgi:subtilase family protein/fervidolysin-like protein/VCBS repeat protein/FG-GAP repeat protein
MSQKRISVTRAKLARSHLSFALLALGFLGIVTSGIYASLHLPIQQIRSRTQKETVERIPGSKYHPNRLLVRFREGASAQAVQAIHQQMNASVFRELGIVKGLQVVEIPQGASVSQSLRYYRSNPNVLYAEPDYIVQALIGPNDPLFSSQWSMQNTGQSGGTPGADIHAVQAWSLSTGSSGVVVGVIDTGLDYNHQDLAANVWSAPNGFSVTTQFGAVVECPASAHGFNTVANTCDPLDDNGHGTHVSGTIGAVGNNGVGVTGINWQVQLLPCKFLDKNGSGSTGNAIACLDLMKQLKDGGTNIIVTNNSWGGADSSQALHDAIAATMQDGMLFVAAAGNDFSDTDQLPTYPASFYLPNLISVAATDRNDSLATFSNFGRRTVDIAAPGRDILSTTPNNTYNYDSGTSMATPHVTGVVALLKAQNPALDWRGIKNLILAGGDAIASAQQTITQKRLNAFGAMTCSSGAVASRLLPVPDTVSGSVGAPITLSFLNIHCAQPAGNVTVSISPGTQTVTLTDDGTGADLAANDGIYTAQWTPTKPGSYELKFPDGSTASVQVLTPYGFVQTSFNYRTIGGTNLNLTDDSVATVVSPFTIPFGGGSFTTLYVSSNGTISFTDQFDGYQNFGLVPNDLPSNVLIPQTLVAPMWEDLYPLKGTNQNVFWAVTGSAPNRELVVEWRNVLAFPCRSENSATVTFQVVFKEGSSDVLFNYSDVVFGGACSYLDYGQFAIAGLLPSPSEGIMWSDGSGPGLDGGLAVLWQSPPPTAANNPVPVLNSFSPSSIPLFSPDVTLTVNGTGFVPTSVVQWRNTNLDPLPPPIDLPTTYVSTTQLNAILPSAFSAQFNRYLVGTVQSILLTNPAPGGGPSNTLPISIVNPGVPSISSVSPSSASAGDFSFNMDVKGNNLWAAVINWNGQMLFTTQISNTEAIAAVPSSLLATPGTAQVTAVARSPNGGTSNPVPFTIGPPSPAAAGPAQSPALQGTGRQTIGSSGSQVHQPVRFLGWNYGRQQGPAYLKYFSRAYGSPSIARQTPPASGAATRRAPAAALAPQVSLSQPSTLPGFAFHPTLPAGFLPTGVATGDFNRDGKMDWVVSNGGSNDLWIYFGNGDGTAQLPRIIRLTGAAPVQVVTADLRKIGILDLVVAEADSQSLGVLLGNGDGTFQAEVTYFVPGPPLSLAVADVNGDGKLDLVAGLLGNGSTGPLATFLGDGTGKFGAPLLTHATFPIGSYATTTLVLKDLNGDGLPDVVLVDSGGVIFGAHSYLNVGDGTFKHADYFFEGDGPGTVASVAVADLDGDGCADAVTAGAAGIVAVFKGTCDGGFEGFPNVFSVGAGEAPVSVVLADMNGDGKLDVITGGGFFGVGAGFGEEASNLVTVLLGDGTGKFSPGKVYRTEPSLFGLAVTDLNGDGKPEVIVASQDTDTALVLLNDGQGNLDGPTGGYVGYITAGQSGATNAPYSNFLVEDLNGDGKPDLAFVEVEQSFSTPWEFAVMLNDGTGHFGAPKRTPMEDFGTPPAGYVLGDFRNTGRPDLVVSSSGYQGKPNADLGFLPNNGDGSFGKARVTMLDINAFSSLGVLATGDFNKDGKLDLVATAAMEPSAPGTPGTYVLLTLLGNGDGTFRIGSSVPIEPGVYTAPFMMFVGDYNRDGNLDVLVWVYDNVIGVQNHHVYEFLGKGDGTFAAPKLILPNFGFFGMADLNHDGFPDIVEFNQLPTAANTGLDTPSFTVYIGQSDGTFKQGQTYSVYGGSVYPGYGFSNVGPDQILTPMLADFNGDGNIDVGVVMITPYPNARSFMQVLAGNGDGTFTPTYEVIPFDKFGLPTNAADLNGDGRADLIEIDGWPSSFHVIPGVPGPTVQLAFPAQPIVGTKGSVDVNLSLIPATSETVQLSSSDANIQIPSSVTISAGSLSATVPFTIGAGFDSSKVFSISATLSGQTSSIYSYQTTQALAGVHLFTNAVRESTPPGGTTQDYAIGVVSVGGYSTAVQLSCQGLPAGATCLFGTNPLPVAAGYSNGSSLAIQTSPSTPLGTYNVTVIATDGAVSDQLKLTLNVSDFSLSVTPASAFLLSGATANFSLQINAISGWTDLVTINCTLSGPTASGCGVTGTFLPGSSQFSISTNGFAAGDYTLTVSGSADGISHQAAPVVLHVQGATGTIAPASATISVGSSAMFNIGLNSQNGFSDQFTFSCPNAPTGISCAFNPASGKLPASGSLATVLTVTVTSRPPAASVTPGPDGHPPLGQITFILLTALLLGFAGLVFMSVHLRAIEWRWALRTVGAMVVLLLITAVSSCGGGGSSTSPPPPPPPPPPVNVSVSVQAASPSLNVNVGTVTIQVK